MTRTLEITMYYNRIAFEGMDHFPEDGNGQEHTKAAALAWDSAAHRVLQDRLGGDSGTEIRYGNDCTLHGPFITVKEEDEDGNLYEVEPTEEEKKLAHEVAEAADEAGWEAASKAEWNG